MRRWTRSLVAVALVGATLGPAAAHAAAPPITFSVQPVVGANTARALRAGTVWVNMYGGLDPYAAYGGRGLSGYGYEQGPQTIDEYTVLKTVRNQL